MSKKKCPKCKETKTLSKFNIRTASKDGHTARCKMCLSAKRLQLELDDPDIIRGKNLKARFNLSIDDYNHLFLKQKGRCQICRKAETAKDSNKNTKWLCVDHNHNTGEIRGLLCLACNTGIGKLGDSKKTLESAIKYLTERGSYGK